MSEAECSNGAPQRSAVGVRGLNLSYLEWGSSGEPLLLLHGITSSARTWWRVAPVLAEAGYHVFALDMPGHGQSDETDDHRIDAIAELAAGAAEALGLHDATLIGHSWGGAASITLASSSRGEHLFRRCIAIDPALGMDAARGTEMLPRFLDGVGDPPELTIPKLRAANPDWTECDLSWKAEALIQCRSNAVRGLFLESGDWNLLSRLSVIEMPLLMLLADPQYTVVPAAALPMVTAALRPELATLTQIPGTTHNMFRGDGYAPTMTALTAWLAATR